MSDSQPIARCDYQPGQIDSVLEFLKRMRSELRMLRKVRVWKDRLQILDINADYFEVGGLGWGDADVVKVLDNINANYKRERIHEATDDDYKEFKTGRRYAWAQDRVM